MLVGFLSNAEASGGKGSIRKIGSDHGVVNLLVLRLGPLSLAALGDFGRSSYSYLMMKGGPLSWDVLTADRVIKQLLEDSDGVPPDQLAALEVTDGRGGVFNISIPESLGALLLQHFAAGGTISQGTREYTVSYSHRESDADDDASGAQRSSAVTTHEISPSVISAYLATSGTRIKATTGSGGTGEGVQQQRTSGPVSQSGSQMHIL